MGLAIINSKIDPRYLRKYVLEVLQNKGIKFTEIKSDLTDKSKADEINHSFSSLEHYRYILVFNAKIFKTITKLKSPTRHLGYVIPFNNDQQLIIYCPNPNTIFSNPTEVISKINLCLNALESHINNSYQTPGHGIIKYSSYPIEPKEIQEELNKLLEKNVPLSLDIETFSLKHYSSGIATVTLCWSKHEGISFPIDYYGFNPVVRNMLKEFLINFKNTLIYHNSIFDGHILIYQLFMDTLVDTQGLLEGLKHLFSNFEDTKLIAYLCLNSTARPDLSLKALSQEFSGQYALAEEDIKNVRNIPIQELLEYNLIDGLSTWYVYDKYKPLLTSEEQEDIYKTIFKPAARDLAHTQLVGMPIDPTKVIEAKLELKRLASENLNKILNSPYVQDTKAELDQLWVIKRNSELKTKRVSVADSPVVFNPDSPQHLQLLLYQVMGFTIKNFTDSGQPSCNYTSIQELMLEADVEAKPLLNSLLQYSEVSKLLNTFIPALENAVCAEDGNTYLYGNFNLGSVVSGRLSSSSPNLQQLPNKSASSKLIKACFVSNSDQLFSGIDFNSLESRIGALLPKDQAKLDIFIYGYDDHCYKTLIYWPQELTQITSKLEDIKESAKYFRVTYDDGSVDYFTDATLPKECR